VSEQNVLIWEHRKVLMLNKNPPLYSKWMFLQVLFYKGVYMYTYVGFVQTEVKTK